MDRCELIAELELSVPKKKDRAVATQLQHETCRFTVDWRLPAVAESRGLGRLRKKIRSEL
jgi:hypothetical protein